VRAAGPNVSGMDALRDSRILTALLGTFLAPALVYELGYHGLATDLYVDLDSELGMLSQLSVNAETRVALIVIYVVILALQWRPIGPGFASSDALVVARTSLVLSIVGSWMLLEAVLGPIANLFDKIR
jgi:hypothetical protein